tara:strand:+ start:19404 stop:20162 length:759 start_codon:yes stop_codon:yes gene_type:complete
MRNQADKTAFSKWWYTNNIWKLPLIFSLLIFIRLNQGFLLNDFYFIITRPFWPGESRRSIVQEMINVSNSVELRQLKNDNQRLREILSLQSVDNKNNISASVISRKASGWWQQLLLNKGSRDSVAPGFVVTGPGGLIGVVKSVTHFTSTVQLLTAPTSKIGAWTERTKSHGILTGNGSNNPDLVFFQKDPGVKIGDVVTSSPASTRLPPNLPIGIIVKYEETRISPKASVQLISRPEAIDWVQIIPVNINDF